MKPSRAGAILKYCVLVLFCFVVPLSIAAWSAEPIDKPYHHLLILGDPHLPGKYLEAKENVIRTINSWEDVDMVIAVGDICENIGTDEEYAAVKIFFEKLNKPLFPVAGNHDFIYSNDLSLQGKRARAAEASREAKLRKFRETFGLPSIYYSRKTGGYLLVFLSTDGADHLGEISDEQMGWLHSELKKNKDTPTIIFFHAPLKGTLRDYNRNANTPDYVAQPHERIHEMLMQNPQVLLWVSGHTHTSPKEESFASPINVYAKQVTNIHNTDMNRETIWTNSLFLYPDKIVVKTYQHKPGAWLPDFERTISLYHPTKHPIGKSLIFKFRGIRT
jgi:predicted MPP superfamily phosphohydrolase